METRFFEKLTILRFKKNKLARLFFGFVFVTHFISCQSSYTTHNELARRGHAKELLKSEYHSTSALNFESDQKFRDYLSEYINMKNEDLNADQMTEAIIVASAENRYDPVFLLAVIKTESTFNPQARGLAGELGLMQIKPETAEWICRKSRFTWRGAHALKDPVYNVQIGALYFKYLKKSLKSKSAKYINAYNMGLRNLYRLPASSRNAHPYYAKVMRNYLEIYNDLDKIKKSKELLNMF